MTQIENRPARFSDRGSLAVLVVAVCLSVAGLSAAFALRHQNEKGDQLRVQEKETTESPFAPGVKALEAISRIAEPRVPVWASNGGSAPDERQGLENPSATSPNSTLRTAPVAERGPDESPRLSASVWTVPEIGAPEPVANSTAAPAPGSPTTAAVSALAVQPLPPSMNAGTPASTTGLPDVPPYAPPQPVSAVPVAATAPNAAAAPTAAGTASAMPGVATAQPTATANPSAAQPPPVPCGKTQCPRGLVCCNASCGTCARPGEVCSQQVCGMASAPVSTPCGINTCNVGELCCNPYCGVCARSQAECDSTASCMSPVQYPRSVSCGMVTCNTGYVCCNPSCGICARYGEPCSQEPC